MTAPKWTIRCLAVAAALGMAAGVTAAQQPLRPKPEPKAGDTKTDTKTDPKVQPKVDPKTNPKIDPHPLRPIDTLKHPNPSPGLRPVPSTTPSIIVHPQINGFPGIAAGPINQPLFNPGPFYNPALNNPWMNQTRIIPTNPYSNPFNSPFMTNPLNQNPFNNPFNNPLGPNVFGPNPNFGPNPFNNPFANQFGPYSTYTPPVAFQQPGYLIWRGPDFQVNPWSGMVYKPLSGVARTADGSTFYRVPGSGLPGLNTPYAGGSGLYFDPAHGTFLNPASGVISKPGVTNIFMPWIP